jgi:hypothetical protein
MELLSVVEQASEVVDDCLSLIEELTETKQFQAESKSRLVCRCPACTSNRSNVLAWTRAMRSAGADTELQAA